MILASKIPPEGFELINVYIFNMDCSSFLKHSIATPHTTPQASPSTAVSVQPMATHSKSNKVRVIFIHLLQNFHQLKFLYVFREP